MSREKFINLALGTRFHYKECRDDVICPSCGSEILNGICENCNPEEWEHEFVDQGDWK